MRPQAARQFSAGTAEQASLEVQVHWDDDSSVWWLQSPDLPGLATEATSFDQLIAHIRSRAPVLVRDTQGYEPRGILVHLSGDATEEILRING